MRKSDEMIDTFPCYMIDNGVLVPLVEEILKRLFVSIAIVAGNRDFSVLIHGAKTSQDEANQNHIRMQMKYADINPPYPKKIDIVGTILIQIVAANQGGGEYMDWCRYFLNKSKDSLSKGIYKKIMSLDIFFRSILTEEEYKKLLDDCNKGGIV